ncbi:alpha/beta fold hydrolase [Aridibaculum aurantiacum]|uniref:alpha/beta fold hydrolase n=1 Tax=Aridibaculum aurantiacum TaxID=2810307 RepID=UPI001A96C559|nr:alpha/beta hydrolase [Aridibaculum aurantiacum]
MKKYKLRWLRITARIILVLLALLLIASFVFDQLVQFRQPDEELQAYFQENKVPGKIGYYNSQGRRIRYASVGNDSLPMLVFIHGAPSSLGIYQEYFRDSLFLRKFKMVALDRPGYGYSGFGDPMPSIQKQAAAIRPLIDSLHHPTRPIIIVGSSYGSSIACRFAMDYPQLVDAIVLVAPSMAPGEEKIFWFSRTIEHPLLRSLVPRMFQSANTEKLAHEAELKKMLPYWKNIMVPVMYMQGEKDELLYTSNAVFAKKELVNVPYLDIHFFPGRPHFIPFTEKATIRKKILHMLHLVTSGEYTKEQQKD